MPYRDSFSERMAGVMVMAVGFSNWLEEMLWRLKEVDPGQRKSIWKEIYAKSGMAYTEEEIEKLALNIN